MATDSDSEYISDLPAIIELQSTDSFVVETLEGTKQILFKDFILGPDNVSFYTEVVQTQEDLLTLSLQVTELSSTVSTLNSAVTALTAGYDEALKTGFATVAINNLGTLTVLSSSVNVANIISTDGGSRIQVSTTGSSIDFTTANIQVTLNYYVSGSSYTNGYSNYSPVIDYTQLTTDAFKVGVNRIDYSVVTYTLPTGSTVTQETVNPITSILQTPAGFDYLADVNETTAVVSSTTVVTGINKTFGNATDLLKSITPIPTSYNMVTGVTIPTNTFEIPYFINQGDLLPIFGRSDTPLIFYITFRYK